MGVDITVIITTILRESLQKAINSATYDNVEIRVIAETDTHMNNVAVVTARNKGLESISTEWVTFLDDDDYWLPDHWPVLKRLLDSVDSNEHLIITLPVNFPTFKDSNHLLRYLKNCEGVPTGSITMRSSTISALAGFDINRAHSAHWDLILRCYELCGKAAVVINPKATWVYTHNYMGLGNMLARDKSIDMFGDRRLWAQQYVL